MGKDHEPGQSEINEDELVDMYIRNGDEISIVKVPFKTWWEVACNSGGVPGSEPSKIQSIKPFRGGK